MTTTPADPWEPGRRLEASLLPDRRRATGAWYTPPALAAEVAGRALDACEAPLPLVCDPACGGGAFLLAAAEHLAARGHERAAVVRRLVAMDLSPEAVAATAEALERWCGGEATPVVAVGDALVDPWPAVPDVVVGNPPFLGQLSSATARTPARAAALRARWGEAASGYVDDAALFLLAACRAVRPGGSVGLLQAESVLATRSAAGVRAEVAPGLRRVDLHGDRWFDAGVRVCSVVVAPGRGGEIPLVRGDRWSPLVATARGVPDVARPDGPPLGSVARVWAGFRDEFYGLAPLVGESAGHRVITGGLVDPASSRWGEVPARIGGRRWATPAVDPARLPAWATSLLRPKLLVATQTRVVEAVADPGGTWVPITPVVSVIPEGAGPGLLHLLAVLLAPPVSAWAMTATAGSALSGDALKVSAGLVRDLPLPSAGADWDEAAALAGEAGVAAGAGERGRCLDAAG
ncbi:MAG: N-6 DNA methylase, partial [Acidimicrobiia bacterium]